MNNDIIDSIIENLFYVLPIIHKKLLKIEPPDIKSTFTLSRLHIAIMLITKDEKELSISDIAKKLLIPKPQMTHLISHLVESGLLQRQPDVKDRRVIKISLTPRGKTTLKRNDKFLENNVRKNLSYLSQKELEDLSQSLIKLREVGSRL